MPDDEQGTSGQSRDRRTTGRRASKTDRRKSVVDRRSGKDRRVKDTPGHTPERRVSDRRSTTGERRSGLDRRRGPGRRRSEDRRAAEEGEMTDEQFEFIQAINEYKLVNKRPFPTWTEVLDVIRALGYRKVADRSDIT